MKCEPTDTIGDFKKLVAAQIGTAPEKIVLKKWYTTFKDHITIGDYEIGNGSSLEMYSLHLLFSFFFFSFVCALEGREGGGRLGAAVRGGGLPLLVANSINTSSIGTTRNKID